MVQLRAYGWSTLSYTTINWLLFTHSHADSVIRSLKLANMTGQQAKHELPQRSNHQHTLAWLCVRTRMRPWK